MSREAAKTIMIVEDHSAVRALLHQFLRIAFPEYRFVEIGRGDQAVALAVTESPDLILMDIQMPGMSGIEATRQIKATRPRVKVVIVSNHDEPEYLSHAAKAGASGFVPKRAIHEFLVPLIEKLLDKERWMLARLAQAPARLPGEIVPD